MVPAAGLLDRASGTQAAPAGSGSPGLAPTIAAISSSPHARDEAPGLALVAGGGVGSRGRSQAVAQRGQLE